MDFLTLSLIFLACKEWCVVLSVSKALPRLNNRPLLIQLCWWCLILLILHCLNTACFGLPVTWLILASFKPRKSWSLVPTASRLRTIWLFRILALDSLSSPETLHVQIKASKTDPFRKNPFLCALFVPWCPILLYVGMALAPFSSFSRVSLCRVNFSLLFLRVSNH